MNNKGIHTTSSMHVPMAYSDDNEWARSSSTALYTF